MKQLLLLRHAKSSWDDPALADFDRPLAPRGIKAAKLMGRELAARDWLPDLALVSPALRTRETWRLVSAEVPAPVEFADELYDASSDTLLKALQRTPGFVGVLLLLGHNPGMEGLTKQLAGQGSDAKAMRKVEEKFPTAALARFVLDGDWAGLSSARLTHCLWPKDLG
ncbi:histidine phosphatase family protein [Mesorhizobium sp. INR15]|uniref:SixA phosphatase family protein n=1 Tax=Mesorhizobium sp. INR15 TaxID=2654248 RepID=UPI0018964DC7|nr:histidine phosphatase family protein [Mesorhizobium sp. INR15]QPC93842.1 histidine phosphatase family protein [Mesorhizobium sp. INR15]